MAIQPEFIDFIVPIKTIMEKYPGGWEKCFRTSFHFSDLFEVNLDGIGDFVVFLVLLWVFDRLSELQDGGTWKKRRVPKELANSLRLPLCIWCKLSQLSLKDDGNGDHEEEGRCTPSARVAMMMRPLLIEN